MALSKNTRAMIRVGAFAAALMFCGGGFGGWIRQKCLAGSAFACSQAAFFNVVTIEEFRASIKRKK